MHVVATFLIAISLAAPPSSEGSRADAYERPTRATEWEVFFEDGISLEEYARQIDAFGIEMGVVDKKGQIQYVSRFTAKKPEKRLGQSATEKRISIGWKRGTLQVVDRKLLKRAGVNTDGKDLFHYYPREVEVDLFMLEAAFASREPLEIKRTRFKIAAKQDGQGYEFQVVEQDPADKQTPPSSLIPNTDSKPTANPQSNNLKSK